MTMISRLIPAAALICLANAACEGLGDLVPLGDVYAMKEKGLKGDESSMSGDVSCSDDDGIARGAYNYETVDGSNSWLILPQGDNPLGAKVRFNHFSRRHYGPLNSYKELTDNGTMIGDCSVSVGGTNAEKLKALTLRRAWNIEGTVTRYLGDLVEVTFAASPKFPTCTWTLTRRNAYRYLRNRHQRVWC